MRSRSAATSTSAPSQSAAERGPGRVRATGGPAVVDRRPAATQLVQLAALVNGSAPPAAPVQFAANRTGLPDNLKAGVESLSGHSLDHVRVHLNSPKPAQLQAHAYAQGSDIHVGPGQEKHLPHEAWHVVQQMQGRVQPTKIAKKGIPLNDDAGLEREADHMGATALQRKAAKPAARATGPAKQLRKAKTPAVQRTPVVQRDPWDPAANLHETNLAANLNARLGVGVAAPHPVAIGPQQVAGVGGLPPTTTGTQKHFDADMRNEVSRVMNYLPASHIIGNPALTRIVMENATQANPGVSYFGGGQLHIVVPFNAGSWIYLSMSKWPVGELATTPITNIGYAQNANNLHVGNKLGGTFSRDVLGTGTIGNKLSMLGENFVRWLITHETGHSVDAAIGYTANQYYRLPALGGWLIHDGTDTTPAVMGTSILTGVGLNGHVPELDAAYLAQTGTAFSPMFANLLNNHDPNAFNVPHRRQARNALQQGGSPLGGGGGGLAAPVANGAWRAERLEDVLFSGLDSPWQQGGRGGLPLGNRTYQVEYQHSRWVSYDSAKYGLRNSNYQMSGPDEWFAETYAHYFTHSSLRFWQAASAQWGRKLNDPAARAWFLANLDVINNPAATLVAGNALIPIAVPVPAMPVQNAVAVPGLGQRIASAVGDLTVSALQVGASGLFRLLSTVFLLPLGLIKYLLWLPINWVWRKLIGWLFG